jgi:hypothetical protein
VAQRIGEEIVEEFGGFLPVQFRDFGQCQQELAEVRQARGNLEGEGADNAVGVPMIRLVVLAELDGDDFVPPIVREVGGEGALADAWSAHDPEKTRGAVGGVPP